MVLSAATVSKGSAQHSAPTCRDVDGMSLREIEFYLSATDIRGIRTASKINRMRTGVFIDNGELPGLHSRKPAIDG